MLSAAKNESTVPVTGSNSGGGTQQTREDAELFAKELGARLNNAPAMRTRGLEKLAAAFPGTVVTPHAASGLLNFSNRNFAVPDASAIAIAPEILERMTEDEVLFDRVKSLLESLFAAGASQSLVRSGGSSTQRGATISGTEARYIELQRGADGGRLSVAALTMETDKFVGDALARLLASHSSTSRHGGHFSSDAAAALQSNGFGNLLTSTTSWRFEAAIFSNIGVEHMLRSQRQAVSSLEIIIQQWELEGGNIDLFTYMQAMGLTDPLVLDLGDEGINLSSAEEGVYFDIKGDGTPVKTAWIKGNNAFLYLDANGNGIADDANELFGDHGGFANGFEKLAQYDDNGDGVIDEKDAIFSQLRLWRDSNGDGINQKEESMTLAEAGIQSINLRHDANRRRDAHGNVIGERSTFTRSDGSTGLIADVWLRNR